MQVQEFILNQGEQLFGKRGSLLSLWQTIADNFYPERADFTTVRNVGEEFADNLTTSYPILARRDLGNAFGAMLRPSAKSWKKLRTKDNWERVGTEERAWLERADAQMTRAMYHADSQFTRATKEADHDFAAFGQAVIHVSLNKQGSGLLYRCYHLRDVAWIEDENGKVTTVFRRWKPSALDLKRLFGNKISPEVARKLDKDPYCEFEVWHCIMPADVYAEHTGGKATRHPFVSIYFDKDHKHIMEEVGLKQIGYVIPRWQTVSGSQYAYSPATVAALPDARLIQAITRVLLEAGEKATNPPMIAVQEALRSDISIYAGGVTWVDESYDERMGEVLRPLTQDTRGIPLGMEMGKDIRAMIAEAFYLNKISLPQPGNEMTAYEVGQRVQEYIRQAMPLFEPMENEYNAPLCDLTFDLMMQAGAFGSVFDIPEGLQDMDVDFVFESPLHDAVEREKGQRFLEAGSMLAQAAQIDTSAVFIVDVKKAFRDVLQGIGVPAAWTRSETEVKKREDEQAQALQTQQLLANMQQGADVVQKLSSATAPGAAQTAVPQGFGA